MPPDISEHAFEDEIERSLLKQGAEDHSSPDSVVRENGIACGDAFEGGYQKRRLQDYDRTLCLIPQDTLDFILATQPQTWTRLSEHYGKEVQAQFLNRLVSEIGRRGALDVLRKGIKDRGCKFQLAYFPPASGLNEETRRLHKANLFSVVRQLQYSTQNRKSVDLALVLNGIPIFTAELKNPFNGQDVRDAISQYKTDRDPREPLLSPRRCLAHFAVDPDLVYVTTRLAGSKTIFLPFNQGKYGGAGNPPVPLTQNGYSTAYLWETIWTRDSVLDLIRQFVHEAEFRNQQGHRIEKRLIFPRYHQIDCVRRLVAAARCKGTGQRYLIQHSAGSGKSFTIAWLAHQLSTLHDAEDQRVFDSIVIISDRRVLDRQLQAAVRQFEHTLGIVENIDKTSRQLKEALEAGKTIIVTTLQKFPVIAQEISTLLGKRFALIVDEAHSSQAGESAKSLKAVLARETLAEAEAEEAENSEEELESKILAEIAMRRSLPNVSTFAFTATPKPKTLELFGMQQDDGTFAPFHTYSMRQAIEEGFILDTLANYTTYKAYWRLFKKVEQDPRYDKSKAEYLLKSYASLHPHAIEAKVNIMLDHFAGKAQSEIAGQAKAMVVTRSRLHAVRYKRAFDQRITEQGYGFKALVAFSGTVEDDGRSYTEAGMNGFPEAQTATTFAQPEYRFLIVANKFQTGFDQPLLHTMYVDKKLGGVNAVQTLSRLNRTHPDKQGVMVLDFANEADEIKAAFEPYYEVTLLSEATDPNLLYEIQTQLMAFPIFTEREVKAFAGAYFDSQSTQAQFYSALAPMVERYQELQQEEQHEFRGLLTDYVRQYAFLVQVLTFADTDLESLYVFARCLRSRLPGEREELPRGIHRNIDMASYRLQQTQSGTIELNGRRAVVDPKGNQSKQDSPTVEMEFLSRIIAQLNESFTPPLGPEHQLTFQWMMQKLENDIALEQAAKVNTSLENVRLAFDEKVNLFIQEIVDSNFELYKRINDEAAFGRLVKDLLFEGFLDARRAGKEIEG